MSCIKTLATVIERPNEAAFREITLCPRQEDSVICKTRLSAISTGTDMKTYHGFQHPEQCWYPLVPGYENVGTVIEEGSYAPDFKKGDRVMINECRRYGDVCAAWGGGTLICQKDSASCNDSFDMMCKIPDNVTDEQAVLAYLACVPCKGIERFNLKDGDTIMVFGAGMVGISAMQILKIKCPTATVIAVEPHPYRQEIAKFYADYVITPDEAGMKKFMEITNGRKADKIIECSGNPAVPGILWQYIKDGGWQDGDVDEPGHIHLQGDYPDKLIFDHYHHWFTKNVNISLSCALKWHCKPQILQWISEGKFDTSHLPYEMWEAGKAKEAFEYQHKKGMECFKILFDWRSL